MTAAITKPRQSTLERIIPTLIAVTLYGFLASSMFKNWREGHPVGLGLMLQESLLVVLFIVRRPPKESSHSAFAWVATMFGTFGAMALRPSYSPLGGLGPLFLALQIVGVVCSMISLGWLGRSFGLVAANRGIRVNGPYNLVRHPVYASYTIVYLSYLLENPTIYNVAVLALMYTFQILRMGQEEAFLSQEPEYRAYTSRVRYRLIPFIY